jgi:D-alanine-D-alanine ligase
MHVALAFNMKRDTQDNGSRGQEREDTSGTGALVMSRTDVLKQRADTYAEWDTQQTIDAVRAALEEQHDVTLIEADEECFQKFRRVRPEIVFNIAEGMNGVSREAQVPAILEMLGIPYTGSDPITLGICLDKSRTKEILSYYNIPTPAFSVITGLDQLSSLRIPFPLIVKPLHEGSSKGIFDASVVRTQQDLQRQVEMILLEYNEPALVEEFLPGREFTVALLGNEPSLQILPIVEIRFDSLPDGINPIYSYEAKWIWDQPDHPLDVHQCPARIPLSKQARIEEVCRESFRALRCRDWCRIDVRLDAHGVPHVIELNPLPGILPDPQEHSCFPQAARAAGISYNSMIQQVLAAALSRYELI